MKKRTLHYVAGILTFCMLLGMTLCANAEDADTGDVVQISEGICGVLYQDIAKYRVADESGTFTEVPTLDGYVFAGWYTSTDFTAANSLNSDVTNADADADACKNVYAKFVSEEVLSVQAQIPQGTDSLSASTTMRFVTTVDSLAYESVGFSVTLDGITYIGETNTVAKKLKALSDGEVMELIPSEEFHQASVYFMACNLRGIPAANFEDAISVTPYWVTLDGSKVYGKSTEKVVKTGGMPTVCEAQVTSADGSVDFYETLEKCFTVSDGSNQYLSNQDTVTILQENIVLTQTIAVYSSVTLTNQAGKNVVIKRSEDASADDLTVVIDNHATGTGLAIQGNETGSLTFDGEETESTNECLRNGSSNSKTSEVVTLKNITMQNFTKTSGDGGAIVTSGTITLENCSFQKTQVTAGNGGAIYLQHGIFRATGCTFSDCASANKGGAIHIRISTGTAIIQSSTFRNNQAGVDGGAVGINNGTINIKDSCSFTGNQAKNGGAVYLYQGTTTIDKCDFEDNSASALGGAIYVKDKVNKLNIQNGCNFTNNSAVTTGGAIHVGADTVTLTDSNSVFQGNTADGNGGAICFTKGTLITTGSQFINNTGGHGAAIRIDSSAKAATIEDALFEGNKTGTSKAYNGGAINTTLKGTTVTNTVFKNNIAQNQGGAIRTTVTMNITGCTFEGNSTVAGTANAGAIYNDMTSFAIINTTLISQEESDFKNITFETQSTEE